MFPLPLMIIDQNRKFEFHNGIITKLPPELCDRYRLNKYAEIDRIGWGSSEFSYSYFAFTLPLGQMAIFPGLFVKNYTMPSKKFHGYSATISQSDVEDIAKGLVSLLDRDVSAAQGDQALLVHDLRALSNSIYNPAIEAQRLIDSCDFEEAKSRIDTVIAAQGILRMRIDALDFGGNAIDHDELSDIEIFKKVDKVQRCFKSMARSQGKSVILYGQSYRKIFGQEVFELVPYTIIDNAVKYSPKGYEISVTVRDDSEFTLIEVKSYGPKIESDESSSIFNKYFRGRNAIDTRNPGSGIGLHISKKIVEEIFKGEISLNQSLKAIYIDGINFYETNFLVKVPSFN